MFVDEDPPIIYSNKHPQMKHHQVSTANLAARICSEDIHFHARIELVHHSYHHYLPRQSREVQDGYEGGELDHFMPSFTKEI